VRAGLDARRVCGAAGVGYVTLAGIEAIASAMARRSMAGAS